MNEFFSTTAFAALVLTLGAYQVGLWCQRRFKSPLCNPILIAALLVMPLVKLLTPLGFDNAIYQAGCAPLSYLLTPATVCLAIPLYTQLQTLRRDLTAILAGILAGTVAGLAAIVALAAAFGLEHTLYVSLLPKSITTAMGIALSAEAGGLPALTTAAIIATGILGSLIGSSLCKLLHLRSEVACGVAFGTASHVVGTAKANELGDLMGAVSSLSLVVAGIVTAVVFPLLTEIL